MIVKTIVFKDELVQQIKEMAVSNNRSFTNQVNCILQEALKVQPVDKEPKATK